MRNKKRNRIMLLLILLLGISIGFAALATTLKINGTANVGKNTWNVYWDNIDNISGVEAIAPIIGSDEGDPVNTKVKWSVTFDKPGEYYEFTVDAVNAGTIDAMITNITHKLNGEEMSDVNKLPDYINYSVKYADGTDISLNDLLAKRTDATHFTTKTYKIRIEYDRNAITNTDINNMDTDGVTYDLSFEVTYGQDTVKKPVAFSTDSWDTIKRAASAASQSEVIDGACGVYHVGDTKTISMDIDDDGEDEDYTVRIANCSTPDVCKTEGFSQTACGLVLEFTDIITTHRMNPQWNGTTDNGTGDIGGWEYSDMRAFLNSKTYAYESINYSNTGVFNKLPSNLRKVIINTDVVSNYSGYSEQETSNFNTIDKLYLLDSIEIFENTSFSNTANSYLRQLDYYKNNNTTFENYSPAVKKYNSTASYWWTRSAYRHSPMHFGAINEVGGWPSEEANYEHGVSPAFRIA